MNCEQIRDHLVGYQLGELDKPLTLAIEEHLAQGCLRCETELSELTIAIGYLYEAVPAAYISDEQIQSIENRIFASRPVVNNRRTTAKRESHLGRISSSFACIASLAIGLLTAMFCFPLGSSDFAQQPLVAEKKRLDGEAKVPASFGVSQDKLRRINFVSLKQNTDSVSRESAIWDQLSGEIHFFGLNFPAPSEGTCYVLWLKGLDGKIVRVGVLEVDSVGKCIVSTEATPTEGAKLFVTNEIIGATGVLPLGEVRLAEPEF